MWRFSEETAAQKLVEGIENAVADMRNEYDKQREANTAQESFSITLSGDNTRISMTFHGPLLTRYASWGSLQRTNIECTLQCPDFNLRTDAARLLRKMRGFTNVRVNELAVVFTVSAVA